MIAGIFVGGESTRMGGFPKGRLTARDGGEPLIVRTSRLLRSLGHTPLLVGAADAYADLVPELDRLEDLPKGIGPLGGLGALLAAAELEARAADFGSRAEARTSAGAHVIVVACDMPFLSLTLLEKLMASPASEDVLAARGAGGFWEPFCARYRVASVAPVLTEALAAQEFSFRALFARLTLAELTLSQSERSELRDWDTEADVQEDMKHES